MTDPQHIRERLDRLTCRQLFGVAYFSGVTYFTLYAIKNGRYKRVQNYTETALNAAIDKVCRPAVRRAPKAACEAMQTVSRRMKEFRFQHKITQEEAANLAGLDVKLWQKLETGRAIRPELATVERVAEGMGLTPGELVGAAEPVTHAARVASSAVHAASPRDSYGRGPREPRCVIFSPVVHAYAKP